MTPADAVIACALALLGRPHSIAPIQLIASPPAHASRDVVAFITDGQPPIFLITSSAPFREALEDGWTSTHREGCRKIAGILVHEEWHLKYGPDERGAYLAQMTMLQAMGARPDTINTVRESMMAVLDGSARRRDAGRIARANAPPR